MAFQQLDPPLPVMVTGKGKGMAIAVVDHGPGHELVWITALDDDGALYHAPNAEVRAGLELNARVPVPAHDVAPAHARREARRRCAFDFPEADAEHAAFP